MSPPRYGPENPLGRRRRRWAIGGVGGGGVVGRGERIAGGLRAPRRLDVSVGPWSAPVLWCLRSVVAPFSRDRGRFRRTAWSVRSVPFRREPSRRRHRSVIFVDHRVHRSSPDHRRRYRRDNAVHPRPGRSRSGSPPPHVRLPSHRHVFERFPETVINFRDNNFL